VPTPIAWVAAHGVIAGRLVERPCVVVGDDGRVVSVGDASDPPRGALVRDLGPCILLPGFVNAHSHAFQRRIRGATQRRGAHDPSSFWSWREAMYAAAHALDPDSLFEACRVAFTEMLGAGITCVGEFHYVHHQADGSPHADPNELSWQVVRAAKVAGIKLVLLDVFYERAGAGSDPLPEQRRFCDPGVDAYLARIDALRSAGILVGITPHSVRAVRAESLRVLASYASAHALPIHTHLSEQPRENAECEAEHGCTPAEVFARAGCLDRPRAFTAVHGVHTTAEDHRLLAQHHVCACPTTEADLGDGIVPAARLAEQGTRLALGSDSNAVIDLVQEARALEMNERLASGARLRLVDREGRLWPSLLAAATSGGASALGIAGSAGTIDVGRPFDAVGIDLGHPFLAGLAAEHALDAVFSAGTAGLVRHVIVDGVERA
jgi:formimidoylglutamate deiminase